jgi:hypothetical protein
MANLGLGGECLKPAKGYHFAEGPYVEYEGELPVEYAGDVGALVSTLNAEMARLVEEGVETKVGGGAVVAVVGFRVMDDAHSQKALFFIFFFLL